MVQPSIKLLPTNGQNHKIQQPCSQPPTNITNSAANGGEGDANGRREKFVPFLRLRAD